MRILLLATLAGSYFGSLWLGARYFPHGYDWRRNVISNLLSPRDNPAGYWLPALGVAIAGLCMLPLAVWIDGELGECERPLARRVRRTAALVGIVCLILSALVVPQHAHAVMGMRHAHELLARTSAVGLGLGMICACMGAGLGERLRTLRTVWWATTATPIIGAVGSGIVVALTRLYGLGIGAYLRGTVFWHLAFWEWAGSVAVFVFFASPVLLLSRNAAAKAV
jgi:hypothetical protein